MRRAHGRHSAHCRQPWALRVAGKDEGRPPRPAWRILLVTLAIVMGLWATGVLEFPDSRRRLMDWAGTLTVLAVLVAWVRSNALPLALGAEQPNPTDPPHVRLIRSRRPPLEAFGAPDVKALRRRTAASR
jgi:hypothetical protein